MRLEELKQLNESMSFTPYRYDKEKDYWTWVFPDEWTAYYDPEHEKELDDARDYMTEPRKNPKYRGDMDLNLSNRNMIYIMRELGYDADMEGSRNIPIDDFIKRATKWINTHEESAAVPTTVSQKERRATVSKSPETGMSEISPGGKGPTMVDVGLPEGYANRVIKQMLKIAIEGKKHGATVVAAV